MEDKLIPLSVPNLNGNEMRYTQDALKAGWVSTGGSYINRFEDELAGYVHAKGAVATQSGTAGLHLALLSCGINSEHAVIVPALTFVAAVNPVAYVGAEPIFMDCEDSLCMDMNKLQKFIEQECHFFAGVLRSNKTNKHIKAVLVVHVFGNLADMQALMQIAKNYNLTVIEDATEALGSFFKEGQYSGRFAGTVGDIGVYSFNGNKIITTGGGGMIVSENDLLLGQCRYLSTQAKDDELYFIHNQIGYNYRMTNVQAAIGVAQLEQLEDFIGVKKKNYELYNELGLRLLPFREGIRPNYWFYSLLSEKRDALMEHMQKNFIQTRPVWYLIHKLAPYNKCQQFEIERAQYYWERIVNIPCSTLLSEQEVRTVANTALGAV